MKIFSEELVEKAVKELHIANLAQATICLLYTSDAADD